jgi:hypothetical protein
VDAFTLRTMQDIPEPQYALGWQFSRRESRVENVGGADSYVAVYFRPYTPGIDDTPFIETRGLIRDKCIWVLTDRAIVRNWEDARQDAIETMVEIDIRRKPRQVSNATTDA